MDVYLQGPSKRPLRSEIPVLACYDILTNLISPFDRLSFFEASHFFASSRSFFMSLAMTFLRGACSCDKCLHQSFKLSHLKPCFAHLISDKGFTSLFDRLWHRK